MRPNITRFTIHVEIIKPTQKRPKQTIEKLDTLPQTMHQL